MDNSGYVLFGFIFLLGGCLLWSTKSHSLMVFIAVTSFGLEQIACIQISQLRFDTSLFNYIVAAAIGVSYLSMLRERSRYFSNSFSANICIATICAFFIYYCASYAWSPYLKINDSLNAVPYFIFFVILVPLLARSIQDHDRSVLVSFSLLGLGCLGLALSPSFYVSETLSRAVVVFDASNDGAYGNPLALADTGVFLSFFCLYVIAKTKSYISAMRFYLLLPFILFFMLLGFWVSFTSSRGEFISGIVALSFFACLLYTKQGIRRGALLLVFFFTVTILSFSFADLWIPLAKEYSPRFTAEYISSAVNVRVGLMQDAIGMALQSPISLFFGCGARSCEFTLGMYPHSVIIQAIAEVGILGTAMLLISYGACAKCGMNALAAAHQTGNHRMVRIASLWLTLLLYSFMVHNKKGSLHFPDAYMWVTLSAVVFNQIIGACENELKEGKRGTLAI